MFPAVPEKTRLVTQTQPLYNHNDNQHSSTPLLANTSCSKSTLKQPSTDRHSSLGDKSHSSRNNDDKHFELTENGGVSKDSRDQREPPAFLSKHSTTSMVNGDADLHLKLDFCESGGHRRAEGPRLPEPTQSQSNLTENSLVPSKNLSSGSSGHDEETERLEKSVRLKNERRHKVYKPPQAGYDDEVLNESESGGGDRGDGLKYCRGHVTVTPATEQLSNLIKEKSRKDQTRYPLLDSIMQSSSLARAIHKGDHQLVLECLRQGENPHLVCTNTGWSYLHLMVSSATQDSEVRWIPMIYQFSNLGMDMNPKNKDGITPARLAIDRRLVQVLAALMKCGAELSDADEYEVEQIRGVVESEMLDTVRRLKPSYWSAVHDTTPFKVKRLVKSWSRINVSRDGQTLIEYAKRCTDNEETTKLLLQHEASIELAHAVMAGDTRLAEVLMCNSTVDLSTCDTSVKTNYFEPFAPLTLTGAAIKYGHQDVLKLLRERQQSIAPGTLQRSLSSQTDPSGIRSRGSIGNGSQANSSKNSSLGSLRTGRHPDPATSVTCVIL